MFATAACVAALSFSDCAKKPSTIERVAILPANLLMSDPGFEWLKLGVPVVLQHDLMTAQNLIPGFAADETGATQGGATRVLRTSIESRQGGLHIEATLVDPANHKVVRVESADASSASVLLPSLNALAKKLDASAVDFSTKSQQAWQTFAQAEGSTNPQQRFQFLTQALAQDASFGAAAVGAVDMIQPNRQADYKAVIDGAKNHRDSYTPFDRAKFDMALNRLSNAPPADQIKSAQEALKLAPNDLEVLTTLGNYQILAGDTEAGEQALRRAAGMNPANVGLRASLARALMETGKYKEADGILSSIGNVPAVYPDLATCVLLEGDKARADGYAEKFVNSVQNEEVRPLLRGAWMVMAGDRQKGIDQVLNAKFAHPELQSMALSEAVMWQLLGNDNAGAQKTVAMLKQTPGQAMELPVITSLFADKTSSAADWQQKVQSLPVADAIKQPILAYGFFLRGNYDESAKIWQKVLDDGHGVDLHARAMLASALDHSGKKAEAQKIKVMAFTPEFADLYSAVSFGEMRRMLGK